MHYFGEQVVLSGHHPLPRAAAPVSRGGSEGKATWSPCKAFSRCAQADTAGLPHAGVPWHGGEHTTPSPIPSDPCPSAGLCLRACRGRAVRGTCGASRVLLVSLLPGGLPGLSRHIPLGGNAACSSEH